MLLNNTFISGMKGVKAVILFFIRHCQTDWNIDGKIQEALILNVIILELYN